MHRPIVYPASTPLDTDFLFASRAAMVGLGALALDILGVSTLAAGFACTPNSPASLSVLVAPGRLYSLQNIDDTAYGSLAADTTHQILKQGISFDTVQLPITATATGGFSTNWLIQAAYQDIDSDPAVLIYYNSLNPQQPLSGPGNSGTAQATRRKGSAIISAKPGIPAATGSQTTPAPDSGNVGLWVVTVANGQSTIVTGNISAYAGAPFLNNGLRKSGGCLAYRSTAQTIAANANTLLTWDVNSYDTSAIHNTTTNNSRFVVPGGVSKVSLGCNFTSGGSGSPNTLLALNLFKNGVAMTNPGFLAAGAFVANETEAVTFNTPALPVSPGDYFEFNLLQVSSGSIASTPTASCAWMTIEQ